MKSLSKNVTEAQGSAVGRAFKLLSGLTLIYCQEVRERKALQPERGTQAAFLVEPFRDGRKVLADSEAQGTFLIEG